MAVKESTKCKRILREEEEEEEEEEKAGHEKLFKKEIPSSIRKFTPRP